MLVEPEKAHIVLPSSVGPFVWYHLLVALSFEANGFGVKSVARLHCCTYPFNMLLDAYYKVGKGPTEKTNVDFLYPSDCSMYFEIWAEA